MQTLSTGCDGREGPLLVLDGNKIYSKEIFIAVVICLYALVKCH